MSEFLKNNPLVSQLLGVVLFTVFFFTIGRAYIDRKDEQVYNRMEERVIQDMDSLIHINREILEEIKNGR